VSRRSRRTARQRPPGAGIEVKRGPSANTKEAKAKAGAQPGASRVVLVVVVLGLVLGSALLVRQVADYVADGTPALLASRPYLRQNDMISALGSVAMLAFLGFVAYTTVRKANTSR
jgi:hypothetical protein